MRNCRVGPEEAPLRRWSKQDKKTKKQPAALTLGGDVDTEADATISSTLEAGRAASRASQMRRCEGLQPWMGAWFWMGGHLSVPPHHLFPPVKTSFTNRLFCDAYRRVRPMHRCCGATPGRRCPPPPPRLLTPWLAPSFLHVQIDTWCRGRQTGGGSLPRASRDVAQLSAV